MTRAAPRWAWAARASVAGWLALGTLGACSAPPGPRARPPRDRAHRALPRPPAPRTVEPTRLATRIAGLARRFDRARARAIVEHAEQYFRVRGNRGYRKTLERVEAELREGGFSPDQVRQLALGAVRETWSPARASLAIVGEGGSPDEVLHAFEREADRDRATLLVGSRAQPETVFELVPAERATPPLGGKVVLGRGSPAALHARFVRGGGAAGILTSTLRAYHHPERFPDAAEFGYLSREGDVSGFGFSISPRADATLRAALARGPVRVRVRVDVQLDRGAAGAVEATLPGSDPAAAPVVLVAHVDEPGANDNASGVAALVELGRALQATIAAGDERPRRPIVLLWGQENEVADAWLARQPVRPFVGLVLDMVGEDPDVVGAPFLVERLPDPGAVWLRPPDEHTAWGSTPVDPARLRGHLLSDLVEAAARVRSASEGGAWQVRSHPFEGGSDHTSFLDVGVPAVLAWHFPDDAYHTTRDRLERVSPLELERVATSLGAVALVLASGDAADAREVLALVERAGALRWGHVIDGATEALSRGAAPRAEHRIAEAWARFHDEALASVAGLPAPRDPGLEREVAEARARWRASTTPLLRAILSSR